MSSPGLFPCGGAGSSLGSPCPSAEVRCNRIIDYFLEKGIFELIESVWKSVLSGDIPALPSHALLLAKEAVLIFSERNV